MFNCGIHYNLPFTRRIVLVCVCARSQCVDKFAPISLQLSPNNLLKYFIILFLVHVFDIIKLLFKLGAPSVKTDRRKTSQAKQTRTHLHTTE